MPGSATGAPSTNAEDFKVWRVPLFMWMRRVSRLIGLFGLYALVLAGIGARYNGHGTSGYTTGLVELTVVTVAFVLAAIFLLTRRPRARPPIE